MKFKKILVYNKKISKFLFELRNKKYVSDNSAIKRKIVYSKHDRWLKTFLKRDNILYLVLKEDIIIGYVKLEKKQKYFDLGWAIIKKEHNQGIGTKSVKFATKNKKLKYRAIIKKSNFPSIKIAEKIGFKRKYSKKNLLHFFLN